MLRPASVAFVIAASLAVVLCGSASAAGPANPPPGSVGAQPTSLSAGSSAQPGSGATASTGQAGAWSDNQGQTAQHCGVQAAAGGTGYSAQPTQVSSSGTSSPAGCNTSSTGAGTPLSTGSGTANRASTGTGAQDAGAITTGAGASIAAAFVRGGTGLLGGLLWLGLLLLLAILFLLLGFAIGRRRQQARAAA